MVTFKIKSGGISGLDGWRRTPSWCEWINVSSKSSTKTFRFTMPVIHKKKNNINFIPYAYTNTFFHIDIIYILNLCLDNGNNGKTPYFTGWYWRTCKKKTEWFYNNVRPYLLVSWTLTKYIYRSNKCLNIRY